MNIHVGSKNSIKIKAVEDAVALYPKLIPQPKIIGFSVDMPIFDHPKSMKETIEGAQKRAKEVFKDCEYSFGLEGGLMEVPYTHTGYMEISVCAVYNGKIIYLGLSPAFEWPKKVMDLILHKELNANQAFKQLGITHHDKLGSKDGGGVGLLTDNRITRGDSIKYSIIMALIELNKPELYQ